MADANTLTCAQCVAPFPAPSTRRGKVQIYCAKDCQTKAANARRKTTRAGRKGATIETNPRPSSPTPLSYRRPWIGQSATARTPPATA
jgi:hypothetical protein